jgi:hypothetical protein
MNEEFAPPGAGGYGAEDELVDELTTQFYEIARKPDENVLQVINELMPELVELIGPAEATALEKDVQTLATNFPDSPLPFRPQETPLTTYARFAQLAYEKARATIKERIRSVLTSVLTDERLQGTTWYLERATQDCLQFHHAKSGQRVVAVRGTDRGMDVFNEWTMTVMDRQKVPTVIHEQASEMVKDLLERGIKPQDIIVTGHSLGGNIANDVSRIYGTRAITWNEFVTIPNQARPDGFKEGPRVLRVQSSRDYANIQKNLGLSKLQPESVTGIRYLKFKRPFNLFKIKDPHSVAHFVDPENKAVADSLNKDFFQFLEDSYKNTAFESAKKSIDKRLTSYQEYGTAKKGVLRSIKKSIKKAIQEKESMQQGAGGGADPVQKTLDFDEGTKLAKKMCAII